MDDNCVRFLESHTCSKVSAMVSRLKGFNLAFLNLQGHPRGNMILETMVSHGFYPKLVVEEDSKLADRGTNALNSELCKLDPLRFQQPSVMKDILSRIPDCRHLTVKNHNNDACLAALNQASIDTIVLGDCRIMKKPIVDIATQGMVNTHPGLLPFIRGNNCSLYSVIHDLPIGCTAHLVDLDIDTGPIIAQEQLKLNWNKMTFPELLHHLNISCANLALESLELLERNGKFEGLPQSESNLHNFGTFTAIEPIMKAQAITKLESGGYFGGSFLPMATRHSCELRPCEDHQEEVELVKSV